MTVRATPPTAAETFLDGLLAARLSYRCTDDPNAWLGRCPACGQADALAIRERGRDDVAVRCAHRCPQTKIEDSLVALTTGDPRDHRIRELEQLVASAEERADMLLDVVRMQDDLLDRFAAATRPDADEPRHLEAVAA